jgi:hypothetical protein
MNLETASQRGLNPFDNGKRMAMESTGASPYDARARGVDGDMLDAMLKGRWQEGHKVGFEDGHASARSQYPRIYDDAFGAGQAVGASEAATELSSRVGPVLQRAGSSFAGIADQVRAVAGDREYSDAEKEILELCADRLKEVGELLDGIVGEHTAEAQEERAERVNAGVMQGR